MDLLAKALVFDCYPNPADHSFTLVFTLSQADTVSFIMTDVTGKTFKILPDRDFPSGSHHVRIDIPEFNPGLYTCRLSAGHSDCSQLLIIH